MPDHREVLPYVGFRPLRPGRIHVFCPDCGCKLSNLRRVDYDPPTAVLVHIPCERCSQGCKVDGPDKYLDAYGEEVWVDDHEVAGGDDAE